MDHVAFRIAQARETTVGILLGVGLHLEARRAELIDHGIQVGDPEVDRPGAPGAAELVGVGRYGREDGRPSLLPPWSGVVGRGWRVDSEVRGVPSAKAVGVPSAEEHPADPRDSFYAASLGVEGSSADHAMRIWEFWWDERLWTGGSSAGSLLRHVMTDVRTGHRSCVEDPGAEQVELRAAVHLALSILIRLTLPSTGPELQVRVSPLTTAS